MGDPTGRISHLPEMHRGVSWKQPVVAASTANGNIGTAFVNGATLDGVTLATGDRILLKDQSTGSQNGIYVVTTGTPTRAFDMDQDATDGTAAAEEVLGAFVYVLSGTSNGGKLFYATNSAAPVLGTTSLVFAQFAPASSIDYAEAGDLAAVGTVASAGVSSEVPRADHVHTIEAAAVRDAGRWATVYGIAQRGLDLYVATGTATIANTTTETTMVPAGEGSLSLPPNFFTAGKAVRVRARGQLSDTGTPNFTVRLKLGSTTIASVGPTALTGVSSVEWIIDSVVTCRSAGASGKFIGGGMFDYNNGTDLALSSASEVTLSTLGSLTLSLTWEWGTANPSNTVTTQELKAIVVDPNRFGVGGLEEVLTPDGDDVVEGWVE